MKNDSPESLSPITESDMLDEIHQNMLDNGNVCDRNKLTVTDGTVFYDNTAIFKADRPIPVKTFESKYAAARRGKYIQ